MRIAVILILVLSFIRCAPTTSRWEHIEIYDDRKLGSDTADCKHEAKHASMSIFKRQSMGPEIRGEDILAVENKSFTACMASRGWHRVKVEKSFR